MKFYKLLILLLIYFAQTHISYSDVAHYVDFKYVLNKSDAGAKAQKSLKNKLESGVKSLNKKQSALQEEEKNIIKQKKIISEEEYKKKVTALRKKVSDLQKERKKLLGGVSKQRTQARNELLKNLNPIIKEYMKEKNIRMVLNKQSLLVADESLDITNDIIALLNKKLKSINIK